MRTKPTIPALCLLFAAILAFEGCGGNGTQNAGFSWPCWRGPTGNGISQETGWNPAALTGGAKVLWNVDIGTGYSNIAIHKERIYALGILKSKKKDKVAAQCRDARTGKIIWRREFPWEVLTPQATPAIEGDFVYVLTGRGLLFCLKAADGEIVWKKHLADDYHALPTSHGWAASPVVEGDLLLLNANNLGMALDKKTGQIVWAAEDSELSATHGSYASASVNGSKDSRYALFLGIGTLSAVGLSSGNRLWSFPHGNQTHPVADPIVLEDRIFLMQDENCILLQVTGNAPQVVWSNTSLCGSLPTPVLIDGYLYCTHIPQEHSTTWDNWAVMRRWELPFRCVDWETGSVKWEKNMQSATVTAADGRLLLLEVGGTLHVIEATPSAYRELSSADVFGGMEKPRVFATPPVLCNGRVYCRNLAGDLVCVDVSR